MSIFKNKKISNSRTIYFMGKVLYRTSARIRTKKQWFFGGLFSVFKINEIDYSVTKKYYFMKKLFLKENINSRRCEFYFKDKLILSKDLTKPFIRKYRKYFNNYKNIFILNANSGEIYLFLTYALKAFLQKNKIDDALFITDKQYHIDLINLICPHIASCLVKKLPVFREKFIQIEDRNFYMLFTKAHFLKVEQDIKENPLGTVHYFDLLLQEVGLNRDEIEFTPMHIPDELKQAVINKAKKIGLNLDNFVFVAPEAYSCEECSEDFWKKIIEKEQAKSCDVYMNIANPDNNIEGIEYKTCDLSFVEAIALASMSKKIISLRSGLTECLMQCNVPMEVLYTPFKQRYVFNDMKVERVKSGFGIKQLPSIDTNKIREFNTSEISKKDEIIRKIMNNMEEEE